MRVLAVSDEAADRLWTGGGPPLVADLVVGCGDVDFDLLGWLGEATGAPVVFVPGNHDPDVSGYRPTRSGLVVRAGFVTFPPWPAGAVNADGRVVESCGLRIAGLGGCLRYRDGPNQYTQAQQRRRGRRLVRRARWGHLRRQPVDLVLAHAAPRGLGDGDDAPHVGFDALHHLARALRPRLLLHGHVAPAPGGGDHWIGATRVVNVFGSRILQVPAADPATRPAPVEGR
ncbi:hypothetical protein K6U06_08325 [Acidiferrimicrobium sp. IK]|uniref:metallophosphoesterase family protein n=1 Tax=Acidiferrimicrobium sp. IK TaxID=2871700 RepID=UPI0021CB60F7|nr:metallophosphoesterase [Acidiferrimicrobium sp. IK]MCU4184364.1 hypothetical protein [Acidiferrimicrobium sp. IK]